MELSYYWTLGPCIDIGWVPDTFTLIHLFICSIATYRAFIMGSLQSQTQVVCHYLTSEPTLPGWTPLSVRLPVLHPNVCSHLSSLSLSAG